MKTVVAIALAMLVAGCSITRVTEVRRSAEVEAVETYEYKFVRLVDFLRSKTHNARDAEVIKVQALALAHDAGFRRECDRNRRCFLVYRDVRVTIDDTYVTVERSNGSYSKYENLELAIKNIYG